MKIFFRTHRRILTGRSATGSVNVPRLLSHSIIAWFVIETNRCGRRRM
jgi:hypothetical protein